MLVPNHVHNLLDQGDRIHESFKSSMEFGDGHDTVDLP